MALRSVLETPGLLKSCIFAKAESWVVTQGVPRYRYCTFIRNIVNEHFVKDIVSPEIKPGSQSESVQLFLILKILM